MFGLCLLASNIPCVCAAKAYFDILFLCYKWEEEGWLLGEHIFLCIISNVMWIMAVQVVGFQSLVVHCFLLLQIIAVVVCHWMGCKLSSLTAVSFLNGRQN